LRDIAKSFATPCSTAPDIPPSLDKRGYSATREEAMADFKKRWLE